MRTLVGAAEPDEPVRQSLVTVTVGGSRTSIPPLTNGYLATTFTPPVTTSIGWVSWGTTTGATTT
jgi:hypothetical protein